MSNPYFVAIDGEGHGNQLVLLAASDFLGDQSYVEEYDGGLTTLQMMEWLWLLKETFPNAKFVGFAFDYDVNMILHPLLWNRPTMVRRLVEKKTLTVKLDETRSLNIRYYPRKFVVFSEVFGKGNERTFGRFIRIEDTFGFYQSSFVKALVKWSMPDKQALERIEKGKAHRPSEFAEMNREEVRE